jgi:hypothetical protein
MSKRQRITSDEEGVLKLMQQPHVYEAVLCVLDAAKKAEAAAKKADAAADKKAIAAEKKVAEEERAAGNALPQLQPVPKGPAKLPSMEEMQAAGYQGSLQVARGTWTWAKEFGKDHVVWPTPTSGVQEALRFDMNGWPHSQTTAAEWIEQLTFWSVLREQMSCGASRAQRNSVEKAFGNWL